MEGREREKLACVGKATKENELENVKEIYEKAYTERDGKNRNETKKKSSSWKGRKEKKACMCKEGQKKVMCKQENRKKRAYMSN